MQNKRLYLVCLTVFPFMICTGIIYSILSIYMASLGLTKSEIGTLFTAGAVGAAISSPFWGSLSDRFGRKKIMVFSMAAFAIVFLGYAFSRNYIHLILVQVSGGHWHGPRWARPRWPSWPMSCPRKAAARRWAFTI